MLFCLICIFLIRQWLLDGRDSFCIVLHHISARNLAHVICSTNICGREEGNGEKRREGGGGVVWKHWDLRFGHSIHKFQNNRYWTQWQINKQTTKVQNQVKLPNGKLCKFNQVFIQLLAQYLCLKNKRSHDGYTLPTTSMSPVQLTLWKWSLNAFGRNRPDANLENKIK